ncbi:cation:proton antiporter [Marimonas arenosa]|uniref:Cation:proton antiporter n=1 Tax=Marimonas arenosa TaxID=1795305 RepID=A0AAE4B375_9RHOB|nr:cation:proton antiporter [Marimonas arenosa]MDQ2089763.1 cation:proton antiporter [Marimonas arenosa]
MSEEQDLILIVLGGLFLAGLAADSLGHRTRLPRVTLLLACGIVVGRSGFDLIPPSVRDWYEFLSVVALTMVAFLLGNTLEAKTLRQSGKAIFSVSLAIVIATVAIVTMGLWALGVPPAAALLLGGIATATDPAATHDAIRQRALSTPFATRVETIVAIDDAWGLVAFALVAVLAHGMTGQFEIGLLFEALREIGLSIGIGIAIGGPAAVLTGRLKKGEPLQTEALGVVFLCAGLALWLDVSFLITGMVAGTVVANFARHHDRAFNEIEHLQWPFMMLFFLLAGASLEIGALVQIGLVGVAYIVLRIIARIAGGWIGARLADVPARERPWYGPALLAQAGVAVGMALVAAQEMPQHGDLILTLVIGTTVFFEILGPVATALAVRRAG